MRYFAIQYEPATGRIRQVLDPGEDLASEKVVTLLNPDPHEAVMPYQVTDPTQAHMLHHWQTEVTRQTGKLPDDLHPEVLAHVRLALGL